MQNDISYSIIIPHYKIPELLIRCINSIPERDDIQIIVVDDCSPEGDKYIEKYPELSRNNLEYYRTPKGGSAGRARNVGLQHATGKWLVFADADDLFTDDAFSTFDGYLNSDADVIIFNSKSVLSEDLTKCANRSTRDKMFQDWESGKSTDLRYFLAPPWGRMIKRALVEEHNIKFSETRFSNDRFFSVCCNTYAKIFLPVNQVVYYITERPGSLAYSMAVDNVKPSLLEAKERFHEGVKTYLFLLKNTDSPNTTMLYMNMHLYATNYPFEYYKEMLFNPIQYYKLYKFEIKRRLSILKSSLKKR